MPYNISTEQIADVAKIAEKTKRRLYFRIGLQVVVLLLTMGYRGLPGDPLQILLQALQSVVAAISGAVIYALCSDLKEAISLQRMYQQFKGENAGR